MCLGFRRVRYAQLENPKWRDTFERYGEEVIRNVVSGSKSPIAEELQTVFQDKHMRSAALSWLTERGDKKANHEWRFELLEWAILSFAFFGTLVGVLTLWHELVK